MSKIVKSIKMVVFFVVGIGSCFVMDEWWDKHEAYTKTKFITVCNQYAKAYKAQIVINDPSTDFCVFENSKSSYALKAECDGWTCKSIVKELK